MADTRQPYTFDRVMRIIFTVCGLLAALYLVNVLKGVLLPFLVACLIAYTLEPVVGWNARLLHVRRRFLPVILTLVETIAIVAIALFFLIPYTTGEVTRMTHLLSRYAETHITIPYLPDQVHDFLRQNLHLNDVSKFLQNHDWEATLKGAVSTTWGFLSSGVNFIVGLLSWCIVFLYVLFIMIDYEKLMLSFRQLIPNRHRGRVLGVFRDVRNAMNSYFRGQALIAFIVGVLFAIGFYIVGLPLAILLGLFIGVLNMVPYMQLLSLPITTILCLVASVETGTDFWPIFWESMAVYVVVQCFQDLFLTPKIMGKAMGLNPAIILLSLSVWGCLLGFLGLIIALPLTTLVLSYYDRYVVQPYVRHTHPDGKSKIPPSPLTDPFDNPTP